MDSTQTRYEQRMQEDLDEIRGRVESVSRLIESQIADAVRALLEDDRDLANDVILGDRRVNRKIREIDRLSYAFIVRHAPSAGHLRYVSAVLRLDVALERIGDYASTIGREVVQMSGPPPERMARDVELISHQARRTLNQALTAFRESDVDLANETYGGAGQTDSTMEKVFEELVAAGERQKMSVRDSFSLLRIINLLKRVDEQAENVCEQVLFAVSGETKDPKTFRILFVDEGNDLVSQMAEAYAEKAFPESATYASSGWAPVEALDERFVEFMDANGVDMSSKRPAELRPIEDEPRHWHIVVGLSPKVRDHIPILPFRTIFLDWKSVMDGVDMSGTVSDETLEELLKRIQLRVRDLLLTLRGPDAR